MSVIGPPELRRFGSKADINFDAHAIRVYEHAPRFERTPSISRLRTDRPIAGHATLDGNELTLTAAVLDETGDRFIEVSRQGAADRPRELGRAVGLQLLEQGAAEIIARPRPDEH